MAMLRNLRNMIKAGISEKHHQWVIKKLTDQGAVTNSRLFPTQFFAAYQALNQLNMEYETTREWTICSSYFSDWLHCVEIIHDDLAIAEAKLVEAARGTQSRGRRGRGGRAGRGGSRPPKQIKYCNLCTL